MELGIENEKDSGLGNLIRACYQSTSVQLARTPVCV